VQFAPDRLEPHVVLAPAERARAVARREGRRFVEEEQFREAALLHQRPAVPAAEREPAADPPPGGVMAPDPALLVVETPSIAVHESACGIGDQLAKRRDPVSQRHRGITVAERWTRPEGST
jgi:hypothetical protein